MKRIIILSANPQTIALCSGILDRREEEVAAAIRQAGFEITGRRAKDDWRCITAVLPDGAAL